MEQLIAGIRNEFGEERAELAKGVITVVRAKIKARNLFGWRTFIEDVVTDLVDWMIRTEFEYSGGAYVNCGMQGAIDHCRYCNAAKRKPEYEKTSLDDERFFSIEDENSNSERKLDELCRDIGVRFGEELARELKPYLIGYEEKLSAEVLAKIRTDEFKAWFEGYRA